MWFSPFPLWVCSDSTMPSGFVRRKRTYTNDKTVALSPKHPFPHANKTTLYPCYFILHYFFEFVNRFSIIFFVIFIYFFTNFPNECVEYARHNVQPCFARLFWLACNSQTNTVRKDIIRPPPRLLEEVSPQPMEKAKKRTFPREGALPCIKLQLICKPHPKYVGFVFCRW